MGQRFIVLGLLALVLALPFVVRAMAGGGRAASAGPSADGVKLVVVTPHIEQIREEFGIAFDRWHRKEFGTPAYIDWRTPGGTSDIMKQLEASFAAAARSGAIDAAGVATKGSAPFDLFFGGGSFEHGKMKEVRSATGPGGKAISYRLGRPAGFSQAQLDEWFGENRIGAQTLYDPDRYWIGTALSGFGIVFNKDVLARLGLPEPRSFADLCDARYRNMLALADGRQSGSVTTTYESIMNKEGWGGWRTLRELCANARYFASAATRPPIDVSQGEAAAGLAIDFYGRGQAQAVLSPGQDPATGRVGYVDPAGAVYIDADPASILNGAQSPELAERFIVFCLTEQGQSLWQFKSKERRRSVAGGAGSEDAALAEMGPERYELRRMPVRRVMYEKHLAMLVDQADPFKLASDVKPKGWRSAIAPMMAAFGIDTAPDLREAWRVLNLAREKSKGGGFPAAVLAEMETLFYAMPTHQFRPGSLYGDPAILAEIPKPALDELASRKVTTFAALASMLENAELKAKLKPEIAAAWETILSRRAQFERSESVPTAPFSEQTFRAIRMDVDSFRDLEHGKRTLIAYTKFFKDNYQRVIRLGAENGL
ncbi:MAG: extracellular solute-binding protein [Phycisphaerales bacterium]|nr:extracellular solute-binding protein [Phycisphaerales bacterium]